MTNFVIIGGRRGGTTLFRRLLSSNPGLNMQDEIIHIGVPFKEAKSLLDSLYVQPGINGFKLLIEQCTPALLDYFQKNNIKIIQLIRNDLVTQAIWYTGNYNTSRLARRIDFNAKYPDAKVRVQKTANTIESIVKFHKHLEPIASITLFYEGDLSVDGDGTKTFYNTQAKSNLCNSLGISSFEFNIEGRVKSNKDFLDSDDIFVNIQELYDELKKRGLKRFYKDI